MSDAKSLSHSKWRCKYHIVFAPKYRRQAIYRQLKQDVGKILRDLCERKKVEIIDKRIPSLIQSHKAVQSPQPVDIQAFGDLLFALVAA